MTSVTVRIQKLMQGLLVLLLFTLASFGKSAHPTSTNPGKVSLTTGIPFNQEGGFQISSFKGQVIPPNMVYIEGGTFVMGNLGENLLYEGKNEKKTVSVTSFYMDQTPVTNLAWLEYLDDLKNNASPEEYEAAKPNEKVWKNTAMYNDPLVNSYLEHPGFRFHPVVGVSFFQAEKYCAWRTKKVNEYLSQNADQDYTDTTVADEVLPLASGVVLLEFRLPTEAEWEYAARGIVGTLYDNLDQAKQRIYPWDGLSLRGTSGKYQGKLLANIKQSRGNYKSTTGESDGSAGPSYVYQYPPNDFGLYDMVGNVNEWVYRTPDPADAEDMQSPDERGWYKGGGFSDCGFFAQIGTRRYLDPSEASATIGFRCAMTSPGGQ